MNLNRKKFTAVIMTVTLLAGIFATGFTYQSGIEYVYYETQADIYERASYHEQLAGHSIHGIERAYFVSADTQGTDLKPYVFEGEVTGTYTLDTMINTLESQGYKVVAGINGDLYDTATGTPKGLTIHKGKIKTSGYAPEYVISFDKSGAASLEKATLGYTLTGIINVPTVITTPLESTQATDVVQPINPIQPTDPTRPIDPSQPISSTQRENKTQTGDSLQTENADSSTNSAPAADDDAVEEPIAQEQTIYVPTPYHTDIGYFNVPHGKAKALHLYNRQYAPATQTSENSVEVILEAGSVEYAELTVGGTIKATVVEVRNGNFNTPIGDSQLVLSTAGDSAYAVPLAQLIPGSTVEISVYDWGSGKLGQSQEALGVYYVLYDQGQFITEGTNLNPRTIIGIKPDGSLLLYVLDGRQPGFAEGLGLTETAQHLVALGCSTVVNMDGGGSSVLAVRTAGINTQAAAKNSPSEKKQRKTTNGLLLVYEQRGEADAEPEHLHTYPSQPLAMPGAEIQLATYATNGKYEPVRLHKGVEYYVAAASDSFVNRNGLFTAGSAIGTAVVEVAGGDLHTTARIDIQTDITFTPNVQNIALDPGETFDINVTARFGYAPIASQDSLFTWSCDPDIGAIDADGLFQATHQTGIAGHIYVEYNGIQQTIPVQIGPASIDFIDTTKHWAREYIGKLAARGVVNGMGDDCYLPDDPLTRAQFLTMLTKILFGLDVTQATPAGFADVPAEEWYYNYVNWGFASGIVQGMDEVTFAPNEKITREQMAIMLDNFTAGIALPLPEINAEVFFTDDVLISPWAADAVSQIVCAGIMGGYPEGNFKPQGNATRAEAATVIYKLVMIRDNAPTRGEGSFVLQDSYDFPVEANPMTSPVEENQEP